MQHYSNEKLELGTLLIAGHIFASAPNVLPETIAQIACEIAHHCLIEVSKIVKNDVEI